MGIIAAPRGLPRVVKPLDLFLITLFTVSVGFKGLLIYGGGLVLYPNGELIMGILVSLAASSLAILSYGFLSSQISRSGGDYIYVTRVLHPAIGFMGSMNMVLVNILWFSLTSLGMAYASALTVFGLGIVSNDLGLINLGRGILENPYSTLLLALLFLAIYFALISIGGRSWIIIQRIASIPAVLGVITALGIFLTSSREEFIKAINSAFGEGTYLGIKSSAAAAGYIPGLVDPWATLGIAAVASLTLLYGFYPFYFMGEVEGDVSKRSWAYPLASTILSGAILILFAYAALNVMGKEFFIAVEYHHLGPGQVVGLLSYYATLAKSFIKSVPALVIIGVSILAWAFMLPLNFSAAASRIIFHWSLDGVAPMRLSYLTKKRQVPIYVNAIITVAAALFLVLIVLAQIFMDLVLGSVAATMFSIILASISAVVASERVGPKIPGILTIILLAALAYFYLTNPLLGFLKPISLGLFVGVWIVGAAWYAVAVRIRRREGVNLPEIMRI